MNLQKARALARDVRGKLARAFPFTKFQVSISPAYAGQYSLYVQWDDASINRDEVRSLTGNHPDLYCRPKTN